MEDPTLEIIRDGQRESVEIQWDDKEQIIFAVINGKRYNGNTGKSSLAKEVEKDGITVKGWS